MGWATRVSVTACRWASRSASLNAAGGSMVAAHFSPSRSSGRVSANDTNRSDAMPGRWLPWPGNRNATGGASPSAASASPGA